jgi:hypothetical protein
MRCSETLLSTTRRGDGERDARDKKELGSRLDEVKMTAWPFRAIANRVGRSASIARALVYASLGVRHVTESVRPCRVLKWLKLST